MVAPSILMAALMGHCPRCGQGKLFAGIMRIVPHCARCNLSLAAQDSGDGPVFFALVVVGFLSVGLAAFTELHYSPPLWVHAVLWIPFTIVACIICMRFFKALLIALQYKNHPDMFQ